MSLSAAVKDCPFCSISSAEILAENPSRVREGGREDSSAIGVSVPAKVTPTPFIALAENPLAFAKADGFPVSKGHTLIIPRRHVASFFETTSEERGALMSLLDEAKALLDKQHRPDGYNIGINGGEAAGQTVMHLHIHLIPRYQGDRPDPRGGVRWIFPDKAVYWERK